MVAHSQFFLILFMIIFHRYQLHTIWYVTYISGLECSCGHHFFVLYTMLICVYITTETFIKTWTLFRLKRHGTINLPIQKNKNRTSTNLVTLIVPFLRTSCTSREFLFYSQPFLLIKSDWWVHSGMQIWLVTSELCKKYSFGILFLFQICPNISGAESLLLLGDTKNLGCRKQKHQWRQTQTKLLKFLHNAENDNGG